MHGQRQGAICAGYSPGGEGGTLECLYTGRCVDVLKKKVYFFYNTPVMKDSSL